MPYKELLIYSTRSKRDGGRSSGVLMQASRDFFKIVMVILRDRKTRQAGKEEIVVL